MPSAITEVQKCKAQKGTGGDTAREPHGGGKTLSLHLMNQVFVIVVLSRRVGLVLSEVLPKRRRGLGFLLSWSLDS